MSSYEHVGYVYYNAHPASPLVIGDLEVMKGWKGNPEGNDDNEIVELATGKLFTCDLDLAAPDVFVKSDGDEVVLLSESDNRGLLKSYTLDDLQGPLGAKVEAAEWEIDVPSGAIVVAIAYNATPGEGADTSDLGDLSWHQHLPFLPAAAPAKPYYAKDAARPEWRGHCIVPVKPGKYAISMDEVEGEEGDFMRLVLRRHG